MYPHVHLSCFEENNESSFLFDLKKWHLLFCSYVKKSIFFVSSSSSSVSDAIYETIDPNKRKKGKSRDCSLVEDYSPSNYNLCSYRTILELANNEFYTLMQYAQHHYSSSNSKSVVGGGTNKQAELKESIEEWMTSKAFTFGLLYDFANQCIPSDSKICLPCLGYFPAGCSSNELIGRLPVNEQYVFAIEHRLNEVDSAMEEYVKMIRRQRGGKEGSSELYEMTKTMPVLKYNAGDLFKRFVEPCLLLLDCAEDFNIDPLNLVVECSGSASLRSSIRDHFKVMLKEQPFGFGLWTGCLSTPAIVPAGIRKQQKSFGLERRERKESKESKGRAMDIEMEIEMNELFAMDITALLRDAMFYNVEPKFNISLLTFVNRLRAKALLLDSYYCIAKRVGYLSPDEKQYKEFINLPKYSQVPILNVYKSLKFGDPSYRPHSTQLNELLKYWGKGAINRLVRMDELQYNELKMEYDKDAERVRLLYERDKCIERRVVDTGNGLFSMFREEQRFVPTHEQLEAFQVRLGSDTLRCLSLKHCLPLYWDLCSVFPEWTKDQIVSIAKATFTFYNAGYNLRVREYFSFYILQRSVRLLPLC